MTTGQVVPDLPPKGGCRWLTTYEHAFITGSLRSEDSADVTCCNCGLRVSYLESWVTVAYGVHGNRLPLPVFLHCHTCSLILDANVAYRRAYGKDLKASLPDPVKVKRQEELEAEVKAEPVHEHDHD